MSGIEISEEITMDQLEAMSGGELLRQEVFSLCKLNCIFCKVYFFYQEVVDCDLNIWLLLAVWFVLSGSLILSYNKVNQLPFKKSEKNTQRGIFTLLL